MAKVYDGVSWTELDLSSAISTGAQAPMPPAKDKDGTIFVSIPSFRDGKRCAETIRSIFEKASDPDKVTIGIIEQNDPGDDFCLQQYCAYYSVQSIKKQKIREDLTKIITVNGREDKCPRFHQIRLVALYNIAASGPSSARALTRKLLANEEYCLQIDAHTHFAQNWDDIAKTQWKSTQNEFAILSTVPASLEDQTKLEQAKASWTTTAPPEAVPRQCLVRFGDNGIPEYTSPADGKMQGLESPLLSHAWSAAFSFSKCHLEETTPYDPFTSFVLGAEQFARYARFWTRGYDVYTPTRNIVFHNYTSSGHDRNEWFRQRRERVLKASIDRIKTYLGIEQSENTETKQANMGVYGLGKRRSLTQLEQFVGIDLALQSGNRQSSSKHLCGGTKAWVPYDVKMSPMEPLFSKATDLDPQPEFSLRTDFVYYQEVEPEMDPFMIQDSLPMSAGGAGGPGEHEDGAGTPPVGTLILLWIFGLVVWCVVFVGQGDGGGRRGGKPKRRRTKKIPAAGTGGGGGGDKEV